MIITDLAHLEELNKGKIRGCGKYAYASSSAYVSIDDYLRKLDVSGILDKYSSHHYRSAMAEKYSHYYRSAVANLSTYVGSNYIKSYSTASDYSSSY